MQNNNIYLLLLFASNCFIYKSQICLCSFLLEGMISIKKFPLNLILHLFSNLYQIIYSKYRERQFGTFSFDMFRQWYGIIQKKVFCVKRTRPTAARQNEFPVKRLKLKFSISILFDVTLLHFPTFSFTSIYTP